MCESRFAEIKEKMISPGKLVCSPEIPNPAKIDDLLESNFTHRVFQTIKIAKTL